MLKYTVLLAAGLTAALFAMPIAAQNSGQSLQLESASGGDGFSLQDWTVDSPADTDDWLAESLVGHISDGAYSFAGAKELYPLVMLAGGLDDDPFLLDARFRTGHIYLDRFGANNADTTDKWGKKALRLSNGDVVTVALVPKDGATSNPAYGAGYNIGMVRYNSAGVKQKWVNAASQYVDSTRAYYVFPNEDVYHSNGSYTGIYDVQEYGGWIYVLAQRYRGSTDRTYDVRVVRFQLGSNAWKWNTVLGSDSVSEWGVGMHFYTDGGFNKLTVGVGRKISPSKRTSLLAGYIVGTTGELNVDTSFGNNGISDVSPTDCDSCKPVVLAASKLYTGVTYIAGNYDYGATDQDGYVTKFDKNGASDTSFGNNGRKNIWFPLVETYQKDDIKDMVVGMEASYPMIYERVYILAAVEGACGTTSAGIIKMGSTGINVTSFGTADGKLVFGGGEVLEPCKDTKSIKPAALALNGNRLAIVGYSTAFVDYVPPGYSNSIGGPSFSVVDKDIGYVSDSRVLTPTGVDIGANGGNGASAFSSVVTSGADSFYAVGTARDTNSNKKNLPMTARVRADRIFGDGLE